MLHREGRPGLHHTMEILIVIGIIAILIGLLLPAVQKVREAKREISLKKQLAEEGCSEKEIAEKVMEERLARRAEVEKNERIVLWIALASVPVMFLLLLCIGFFGRWRLRHQQPNR